MDTRWLYLNLSKSIEATGASTNLITGWCSLHGRSRICRDNLILGDEEIGTKIGSDETEYPLVCFRHKFISDALR